MCRQLVSPNMSASSKASRKSRAAVKAASRQDDIDRIQRGESAAALQRENSVLSSEFFRNAKIRNLSSAIGR